MAAAGCSGRRRFAAACGVLSRCVWAEAAAAAHPRAGAAASTMLLMPGADVAPDVAWEGAAEATVAPALPQAQLTIMHGGRVLVFDDVPADRAAELVRVATGQQIILGGMADDVPVARKGSLRRFMEKRRDRIAARSPYAAAAAFPTAAENGKEGEADIGCCLELGIPGGSARARADAAGLAVGLRATATTH